MRFAVDPFSVHVRISACISASAAASNAWKERRIRSSRSLRRNSKRRRESLGRTCLHVRVRMCRLASACACARDGVAWNGESRLALALDFRLVALVGAAGHLCPQTAIATPRARYETCHAVTSDGQHTTSNADARFGSVLWSRAAAARRPNPRDLACVRALLRCGHACGSIVSVQACACARGRACPLARAARVAQHDTPRRSRSSRTRSWTEWYAAPRGTEPFRTFDWTQRLGYSYVRCRVHRPIVASVARRTDAG